MSESKTASKKQREEEIASTSTIPTISEESTSLGEIKINLSVINNIVRLAALEVPGVVSVASGFKDGIAEMFSKESERGVRVEENEAGEYVIEIHVILKFGVKLDKTASQIQQAISDQINNMTSKSVSNITVYIDGVKMEKEELEEPDDTEV